MRSRLLFFSAAALAINLAFLSSAAESRAAFMEDFKKWKSDCNPLSTFCSAPPECCSFACHPDLHLCCVPTGQQCLGEDGTCCSGVCDTETQMCTEEE